MTYTTVTKDLVVILIYILHIWVYSLHLNHDKSKKKTANKNQGFSSSLVLSILQSCLLLLEIQGSSRNTLRVHFWRKLPLQTKGCETPKDMEVGLSPLPSNSQSPPGWHETFLGSGIPIKSINLHLPQASWEGGTTQHGSFWGWLSGDPAVSCRGCARMRLTRTRMAAVNEKTWDEIFKVYVIPYHQHWWVWLTK